MKLNHLDGLMAFCKVAQHRGFTAAAAELEVSPSALSQAIRQLEARLGVRLLNRTTRSVSLTEAGEAYLARVGPAVGQVIEASEDMNVLQGRPAGTLRLNAARISVVMVLQPMLAGFLQEHPHIQLELTNDEGFVDIVERGFDAGVRLGESVQQDMIAVPLTGPLGMSVVASPEYLRRVPAPRHPKDLLQHNCIRFRFSGTGRIHRWEFQIDERLVEYEVQGNLTISDTTFGLDAALEGIGLAYVFEALALPHIRAKLLKRVLARFSPTFPGFYLYYPNRLVETAGGMSASGQLPSRAPCSRHDGRCISRHARDLAVGARISVAACLKGCGARPSPAVVLRFDVRIPRADRSQSIQNSKAAELSKRRDAKETSVTTRLPDAPRA